jgi:hypothetical protein
MSIERNPVSWDLDMTPILDTPVIVETEDGGQRRTVIRHVEFLDIQLGELMCPLPKRIYMDDDADWIEVTNIKSITHIRDGS